MDKKIEKIILTNNPEIHTRTVFPEDSQEDIEEKNRKPFEVGKESMLIVHLKEKVISILASNGYVFDGATIPFKIGKGNMKLLIPALFHDIICENKKLVNFDRKLSSEIFYKLLIMCHVNKFTAKIMYQAVDMYQRFFGKWGSKNV